MTSLARHVEVITITEVADNYFNGAISKFLLITILFSRLKKTVKSYGFQNFNKKNPETQILTAAPSGSGSQSYSGGKNETPQSTGLWCT